MELNDFRQRIKTSQLKGARYIAALVATRLGLRDALIDWAIIYSIGYAVVAGFTWKGADPNSLLVLWGFSVIIAALILGVLSLKVPHWVSYEVRLILMIDTVVLKSLYFISCIKARSLSEIWIEIYQ